MTRQDFKFIKGVSIGVAIVGMFVIAPVVMSIATVLIVLVFTLG